MYKSGNTNEQKYKRTAWNPNANKIHSNKETGEQARTKQKRAEQTIYNPILTTKQETGEQARTKQKRAEQTIYNPILTTKQETGDTN